MIKISKSYLFSIVIICGSFLFGCIFQMFQRNSQVMTSEKYDTFFNAFLSIFTHNFLLILIILTVSIIPYIAIIPIIFINFLIFGASVYLSVESVGYLNTFFRYIHSIAEIPAILISFSIALRFSCSVYSKLTGSYSKFEYKKRELLSVVVLLIIGALVEALYF
ncbi:MAG: hypothetical protein ACFWTQ_07640 [Lactococcus sp.]|jgi:uncharacterized membrane protein SpoIIM required for sporulation